MFDDQRYATYKSGRILGEFMPRLTVGQKVLVTGLSLMYSDYKNLDGTIVSLDGDYVRVAVPSKKIFAEDLQELRKSGNKAFIRVNKKQVV